MNGFSVLMTAALIIAAAATPGGGDRRPRTREAGVITGILSPGPLDAITDVTGVLVGQSTVVEGEELRTGVTVILPHGGNVFQNKVPAAVFVANGFGKLTGISQVRELGTLETPIALTSTLSTWKIGDALAEWTLEQPGNREVQSVNPVVGECNDGYLSDIRRRAVGRRHLRAALAAATSGPVAEGSVGAGTGTRCLGWKGGIGTASRLLPGELGGWTVGVLVQSNFGGILTIAGAPVGVELGRHAFRSAMEPPERGSCMIVIATDAPVDTRQLERMAARTPMGLARVGGYAANGSGDYAIAFTVHPGGRVSHGDRAVRQVQVLGDDALSPLFLATVEATEEAILNSLFAATTVTGFDGHTADALPIGEVLEILGRHKLLME